MANDKTEKSTKNTLLFEELKIFLKKSLKEKFHYKWRNLIFSVVPIIFAILVKFYVEKSFHSHDSETKDFSNITINEVSFNKILKNSILNYFHKIEKIMRHNLFLHIE